MCVSVPQSNTRHTQARVDMWNMSAVSKAKTPNFMHQREEHSCPVAKKKDGHVCPSAGKDDGPIAKQRLVGWVVSREVGRGRGSQDRGKNGKKGCVRGDFSGSCQGSAVPIVQV